MCLYEGKPLLTTFEYEREESIATKVSIHHAWKNHDNPSIVERYDNTNKKTILNGRDELDNGWICSARDDRNK